MAIYDNGLNPALPGYSPEKVAAATASPPPTAPVASSEVLNKAQQSAFDAVNSTPTSDTTAIRSTASTAMSNFITDYNAKQKELDKLMTSIAGYMAPTTSETATNSKINKLDTSYQAGMNNISEQAIPMEFITGQQQSVENRYTQQRNSLIEQLKSETATREQKLAAAQFLYDAKRSSLKDSIDFYKLTAPESIGTQVDEQTGHMTVVMRNPLTGETYTQDVGQVGTPRVWTDNIAFAQQMGVRQPFFTRDGRTIVNSTNGKVYSTYDAWIADGGRPELVENLQGVTPADREIVANMISDYADAGILPTDNLQVASEKVKTSAIWKAKVTKTTNPTTALNATKPMSIAAAAQKLSDRTLYRKSSDGAYYLDPNVYTKFRTDYAATYGGSAISEFDNVFSYMLDPIVRANLLKTYKPSTDSTQDAINAFLGING